MTTTATRRITTRPGSLSSVKPIATGKLLQVAGRYADHAPTATACCMTCRTCVTTNLLGLAYECVPPKDVPTFIEHVRASDPLELRLHMIGYYQRGSRRTTPLDVILQAAEGDIEAQRQFLKTSFREDSGWQEKVRYIFSIDPETMKSSFLDSFSSWYELAFCELEQQVLPILQRDAAAKQALVDTMAPAPEHDGPVATTLPRAMPWPID